MITIDVNDGDTMIKKLFIYLISTFNVVLIASDKEIRKKTRYTYSISRN